MWIYCQPISLEQQARDNSLELERSKKWGPVSSCERSQWHPRSGYHLECEHYRRMSIFWKVAWKTQAKKIAYEEVVQKIKVLRAKMALSAHSIYESLSLQKQAC